MKKPTISDIANNCDSPVYWSRETMKFFRQKRSDFSVNNTGDPDTFQTVAPSRWEGKLMGYSVSYWRWDKEEQLWKKTSEPA